MAKTEKMQKMVKTEKTENMKNMKNMKKVKNVKNAEIAVNMEKTEIEVNLEKTEIAVNMNKTEKTEIAVNMNKMEKTEISVEMEKKLLDQAVLAQKRSYSPYSQHRIGAAIMMSDQKIYAGCNVENSSFGATVCAERSAVFQAISRGESRKIKALLVLSDQEPAWPPCGMCLQVICEFSEPNTLVFIASSIISKMGREKIQILKRTTFSELFPQSFHAKFLFKTDF